MQGYVSLDSVQHDYLLALLGSSRGTGLSNGHAPQPPSTSGQRQAPICSPSIITIVRPACMWLGAEHDYKKVSVPEALAGSKCHDSQHQSCMYIEVGSATIRVLACRGREQDRSPVRDQTHFPCRPERRCYFIC